MLSSMHPALDKRVFEKEARSLAAAGFNVVHLCPGQSEDSYELKGVRIITYVQPRTKWGRLLAIPRLYRRAHAVRARAYHCNEPDSWLVGAALRLRLRCVLVLDVHEDYPSTFAKWLPERLAFIGSTMIRPALQVIGLCAHLIVLANASLSNRYTWTRKRSLVVLNATSIKVLADTDQESPVLGNKPFAFVHSGIMGKARGADVMIQALSVLVRNGYSAVRLVIVGGFAYEKGNEFQELIKTLNLSDHVDMLGWVSYEEAFRVLKQCDAGVILFSKSFANNVRGTPHKMFDYMLASLPIIAPDFAPEMRAILEDANCALLVDTDSVEAVSQAMEQLAANRDIAKELGQRGHEAAIRRYNWEHEAAKLIDAYNRLLPLDSPLTAKM